MQIALRKVLADVRKRCQQQDVECIVSRSLPNISYLTGFSPHSAGDAAVLITGQKVVLFSDDRYAGIIQRIAQQNPLIQAFIWDRNDPLAQVVGFVKKGQKLGLEETNEFTSYAFVQGLKKAVEKRNISLKKTKDIIEYVRAIKFPREISILEQAFKLTDQAFEYVLGVIKPGNTEIEIAYELGSYLRKISGCEELSFRTIVASGPNSAIPHAEPGKRAIKPGDFVTLDFGLVWKGYHSDITRTILLSGGKKSSTDEMNRLYHIVLEAQVTAAREARIGMTGQELDSISRAVITKAGYGKYFTHGTGHGVGLEGHEQPWITKSDRAKNVLEENMVFSIEPGIYLPHKFGVRIEDVGVLTGQGFRSFCKAPKNLITI